MTVNCNTLPVFFKAECLNVLTYWKNISSSVTVKIWNRMEIHPNDLSIRFVVCELDLIFEKGSIKFRSWI